MLKKGRGAHVLMEVRSRGGAVRRLKKGGGEKEISSVAIDSQTYTLYKFCKSNIQTNANRYERGNIGIQANGSSRKREGWGEEKIE